MLNAVFTTAGWESLPTFWLTAAMDAPKPVAAAFEPEYYSTVAQILPVVFVLLFVEMILRREEKEPEFELASAAPFLFGTLTWTLGAEVMCIALLKERREA